MQPNAFERFVKKSPGLRDGTMVADMGHRQNTFNGFSLLMKLQLKRNLM